uniref:Uncharacterized protein n=1 Tax=Myotis myotis TaxID=51298 RepID=A0A7J8AMG4_MYOMY|nr:hypothetical protein mMyoMyo1_008176 [Myotis myotis]
MSQLAKDRAILTTSLLQPPAAPPTQGGTKMASLWALRGGPQPRVALGTAPPPPPRGFVLCPSPLFPGAVPCWRPTWSGSPSPGGLLGRCGLVCASGLQPPCCPRTDVRHQATHRAQTIFAAEETEAERPGNSQPPANMAEPITATD